MSKDTLWGIDLGGTKIEGVVQEAPSSFAGDGLCPENEEGVGGGEIRARLRIDTQASQGYEHILNQIEKLVLMLEEEVGAKRGTVIGFGTPGSKVRSTGLMKNCNTTCLNGRELESDLERRLLTGVKIANDADCFALAEAKLGAGRGYGTVFGVIMGTGVGGGIVTNQRLLQGPNGLTGEWGHMTLAPNGLDCYCGRKGCVEKYLSGTSVERHHLETTGQSKKLRDIADSGSWEDIKTIEWMCDNFGRALSQIINVLDPDVIVLGGGAGQVPQLRTLGIEKLKQNVFGKDFVTPVVAPKLGDSAGVFGAALLSLNRG